MSEIVDTNQLCKFYGITRQTILRWREHEDFPFFKDGYHVRFNLEEVDKWIKARKDILTQNELIKAMDMISFRSILARNLMLSLTNINKDNLNKADKEGYELRYSRYSDIIKNYEDYRNKWLSGKITKGDYRELLKLEKAWIETDLEMKHGLDLTI